MRWLPVMSMMMAMPALFQIQLTGVESTTQIENEARDFMAAYADDLRAGRRLAIAGRYDKHGAYRVGEGEKTFETPEVIRLEDESRSAQR